jgi:uncharacterized protein YigA (DUF484 family)
MSNSITPITEDDIANFLVNTPDFFERHAQLLSSVRFVSPHGQRAVSLQERQADMLREKIRALEHRMMEMIRNGSDNAVLADRLHRWSQSLLMAQHPAELPSIIVDEIQHHFMVPQVAIRVWRVNESFLIEPFAQNISDEVKTFAQGLRTPYCGVNAEFEAVEWLAHPHEAQSVALLPLRSNQSPWITADATEHEDHTSDSSLGLLVLASPDPQRFHSSMGTDLLSRIAELASAALSRLR